MAETICVSSPTSTSTRVVNSQVLSTITRQSVTTLPASTLTSVYSTCLVSPNTTSCSTSTTLIPQGGVTSTLIVTVTNSANVPVTTLATLYGSSCRVSSTTHYTPSTDTTPTETPTTTSTITTTSYSTFTGTSVVTSDGTTFTSYYTSVSSAIPVSSSSDGVLNSATSSSTTSPSAGLIPDPLQTNTPAPGNNTGAIVGGTLGGIAALALLALLTWQMIKKSHRFDNLFKDEDTNYYGPPKSPPFNPYQYGLVAQQDTQPIGFSPPNSPGLQHANLVNEMGILNNAAGNDPTLYTNTSTPLGVGSSGNEVGMQGGSIGNDVAYNAPNQTPAHHVRNPSTIPLLVGMSGAVSGHTRPNTGSSRASVSSSDPLGPLVTLAGPNQNMGYPPQQVNSYPPGLAVYAQQHGLGQAQVQPQQNVGHSMSFGSSGTFLTSAAGSSSDTNAANLVPVGGGSVLRRPTNSSQPPQIMPSQRYEDPFDRTGSPVIYQNQPVLRVRNAEPSDTFAEGSSSTFSTPGLSVSGQPTSTVDGKGRALNLGGEKAPLVHLDGGAYQEQPRTPAPPAYMEL